MTLSQRFSWVLRCFKPPGWQLSIEIGKTKSVVYTLKFDSFTFDHTNVITADLLVEHARVTVSIIRHVLTDIKQVEGN